MNIGERWAEDTVVNSQNEEHEQAKHYVHTLPCGCLVGTSLLMSRDYRLQIVSTPTELDTCRSIRRQVFVVEQGISRSMSSLMGRITWPLMCSALQVANGRWGPAE